MLSSPKSPRVIRFGMFEADLESRELRKRGIKLKVYEQTFQLLVALLERPGEIVTRDELRQRLWPDDVFVDFDHGINTAVKKLRETLGDTADNPRFVETIARHGYRFLAPVSGAPAANSEHLSRGETTENRVAETPIAVPGRRLGREVLPWALVAALSLAFAVTWWRATPPASRPLMRLNIDLPGYVEREWGADTSVSPDGSRVVYTGSDAEGVVRLYLRALDQDHATPLTGTEAASSPFFSPDGQSVAFFAWGKLKKVSVRGGGVGLLCEVGFHCGGSWGDDGAIVLSPMHAGGLSRIPSNGGPVHQVTILHNNEISHRWPQVLPGAQAVLFTTRKAGTSYEEDTIDVQSLRTGQRKTLVRGGYYGRYAPSGHLLYARPGVLYAAPMDLKRLELTGPSVPVVEGVANNWGSGNAEVSVTRTGMLAFLQGYQRRQKLVWLDHSGHTEPLPAAAGEYASIRLSPNGDRIAMTVADHGNGDVWVYEWKRDVMTRLTSTPGFDGSPIWTPDGKHIVFASTRHGGAPNLYWIRADGIGEIIRLTVSKYSQHPFSFSPDGKRVAFSELSPETRHDLWTLPLEAVESDRPKAGKPEPFLVTPFFESWPMISPDGRWMAYISSESGHDEIYVRQFPGPGGKWMISTSTADVGEAVWSRTRPELFYTSNQGMMVVSYTVSGDAFHASKPQLWGMKGKIAGCRFDQAPDGKRFLMVQNAAAEQAGPPQLTMLLNFFDELRRRAPSAGGMPH